MSRTRLLEALEAVSRLCVELAAEAKKEAAPPQPDWFSHETYPHGARAFRRHIGCGMRAIKAGKAFKVRREDAEAFWETLEKRTSPRPAAQPVAVSDVDARLAKIGIVRRCAS